MNNNEQEELDKIGSESVLNEHLDSNSLEVSKNKITKENLFTYVAMVLIIIAAIALVIMFLDKEGANPFKKNTTTAASYRTIETTGDVYTPPKTITTTEAPTQATHTYTTNTTIYTGTTEPLTTYHRVSTAP